MKYEQDMAPEPELSTSKAVAVIVVVVAMIASALLLFWITAAAAQTPTTCDVSESVLITALEDKSDWPERTHQVLEGTKLQSFITKAMEKGYIQGSLYQVDKIYIVDAKTYHDAIPKVWIFFVQNGCVIAKLVADKPQMEECL